MSDKPRSAVRCAANATLLLPALLACGGDSTGPTVPPTPGVAPSISVAVLGATNADVPFQAHLRLTVGGDSLARVIVQFEGKTDTLAPIAAGVLDHLDSVRLVGPHAATLIVQSTAGRADTADVTLTGLNPLPALDSARVSPDSAEVTDSVLLTLAASDNRGGVSLVSVWNGIVDSAYSAATSVKRSRWLKRSSAGSQAATIRLHDADGGSVTDSVAARFFVIAPGAQLAIPVRADTAPFAMHASVILDRATVAYDSVRLTLSNGRSQLYTGLARADTVRLTDTLTTPGVTQVTARWYHPAGNGVLRDSVEVLLTPNQPPSGSFAATVDTINEGDSASYTLSFRDDRGVREARFYRVANDTSSLLRTLGLGDALADTTTVRLLLTPGLSDTVEVVLEDRDGLTDTIRSIPVYTDRRPVVTSVVLAPNSVVYQPSSLLSVFITAQDETPAALSCHAITSQGKSASGGLVLQVGLENPLAAADSSRVSASVTCVDLRGQSSLSVTSAPVTALHSDSMTILVYRADSLLPSDVGLTLAGDPATPTGGRLLYWFRRDTAVSLGLDGEAWFVTRTGGAQVGTPLRTPSVAALPLVPGGEAKIGFIPDNPEYRGLLEKLSFLTANDSTNIRSLFNNPSRDADGTRPGYQLVYLPIDPSSDLAPDSARYARMQDAVMSVEAELREFAVDDRFLELRQNNPTSGPADSIKIKWISNAIGYGFSQPPPTPITAATLTAARRQSIPGVPVIGREPPCITESHLFNALIGRGFYFSDDNVTPGGQLAFFQYVNNETCHLTDLTKRLAGIRSWFGTFTFYSKN